MKLLDHKKRFGATLKKATLCYLIDDNNILLAIKKRGFAKGKINAVGGKVEVGESIEDAARRETLEETGVEVKTLEKVAILDFYFTQNSDWNQQVSVFIVRKWDGVPRETEEMKPQWYSINKVPYDKMWSSDASWLPLILEGKKIQASYLFNEKEEVLEKEIKEIS